MAGKKILMLVGEFSEEYEIFVFEQCMHAVGHTVHVICPGKKAGDEIRWNHEHLVTHFKIMEMGR